MTSFRIVADLSVEIDVMCKYKYLLGRARPSSDLLDKLPYEAANYKKNLAIKTRNGVIEDNNAIGRYTRCRGTTLEKMIEVEESNKTPFSFTKSLFRSGAVRTLDCIEFVMVRLC